MAIIEHQILEYNNLISYKCASDCSVISVVQYMERNIDILNVQLNGNCIVCVKNEEIEVLIPINGEISSCEHFSYKPKFKLTNAVKLRHYGNFDSIAKSIKHLEDYIGEKKLMKTSMPYISMKNIADGIYDVYIGVSENVL